jgi:hypothetical protein
MNLPVLVVGLFAFFLWQVRRASQGLSSLVKRDPTAPWLDVDCSTWTPPEWRYGVGQRWVPAPPGSQMGNVCGYQLIRVDHQTGERLPRGSGGGQGGGVQTGQDLPETAEEALTAWQKFWRDLGQGFEEGFGDGLGT